MGNSVQQKFLIVLSTFPDETIAAACAHTLVERRLCACVNIVSGVHSVYRWQGKTEEASEVLAIFKITGSVWENFQKALRELHPYDVPEIIAVPIQDGHPAYLQWVTAQCIG